MSVPYWFLVPPFVSFKRLSYFKILPKGQQMKAITFRQELEKRKNCFTDLKLLPEVTT